MNQCECCLKDAESIVTIQSGTKVFEMGLCRKHRKMFTDKDISADELLLIHNYYLTGTRKIFVQ